MNRDYEMVTKRDEHPFLLVVMYDGINNYDAIVSVIVTV